MKKLLVLAAALAVVLTMFSFPVVAMADFNTDTTTPLRTCGRKTR